MNSSMIGKIEKARRYAEERQRFRFSAFTTRVLGDHRSHELSYRDGTWDCTCAYFPAHGTCSHAMAMERILEGMLPPDIPSVEPATL